MPTLTISESLLSHLMNIKEPTEIRDPSGNVLGTFTPAGSENPLDGGGGLAKLFDRAEVQRRKELQKDVSGRPLSEVLRDIESQGQRK